MGGMYQQKTAGTIEELLVFIADQVKGATMCNFYLLFGKIEYNHDEEVYEWSAYFSK